MISNDQNKDPNWTVESLWCDDDNIKQDDNDIGVWMIAYTGQQKDTFHHLNRCKTSRLELFNGKLYGNWDYNNTHNVKEENQTSNDEDDSNININVMNDDEKYLLNATLVNRNTERLAAHILGSKYQPLYTMNDIMTYHSTYMNNDQQLIHDNKIGIQLGHLMNQHHIALRDGLHLSTEYIEKILTAALSFESDVWGCKLVGSGGGGCCIIWLSSSHNNIERVKDTIIQAGATNVYFVNQFSKGAYIEVEK